MIFNMGSGGSETVRYNEDTDYIQCLKNGQWVDAIKAGTRKIDLFKNGTLYDTLAGYAIEPYGTNSVITARRTPTQSISGGSLKLVQTSGNAGGCLIFNTPIDLTHYSNLKIDIASVTGGFAQLIITSAKPSVDKFATVYQSGDSLLSNGGGLKDVGISNIAGECYIGFDLHCTNQNINLMLNSITVE